MFFDSHCHLDLLQARTGESLAHILSLSEKKQVLKMFQAGTTAQDFIKFPQIFAQFSARVSYGLGLHPLFIAQHQKQDLIALEKALQQKNPQCVALGEIGLDRAVAELTSAELWRKQQDFFAMQLALAQKFHLPVSLHSRKTHELMLPFLKKANLAKKGVLHGFSGSLQQAEKFIELGYFIGVGAVISYERAQKTRKTIQQLPLDYLLLETDSPDMPLSGQQGKANYPKNIPLIFKALCEIKGLKTEEEKQQAEKILWQNAQQLFGAS